MMKRKEEKQKKTRMQTHTSTQPQKQNKKTYLAQCGVPLRDVSKELSSAIQVFQLPLS
jgi:hypothetical protein